jgi:hypothetical protein
LEENGRLREPPLGVLSSTARTFVQDGATTEFATQILGTTLGRTYARLLSTGSRVFYDNSRPSSSSQDPFLVFPTVHKFISPTSTHVQYQTAIAVPALPAVEELKPLSFNEIYEGPTETSQKPVTPTKESLVSVRKEFSVKRNTEVKPAKVKPDSGLPTFTVKNEFQPASPFVDEAEEPTTSREDDKRSRGPKGLFRGGVQIQNEFQKFDTVTYVGFADFTTTVGNTIIIFTPKTAAKNAGAVTSISGEATLRPEDGAMPVVTTVKTFMSHSPGMATKTVVGHSLDMQTSLPTFQPDLRTSKAYNPVYSDILAPSESSSLASEEVSPTEVLPTSPSRFATTTTQVYNPGDEPLGLVKSVGGTESFDGTTTLFTSFYYGTVIDGSYTQLVQTATNVVYPTVPVQDISPTTTAEASLEGVVEASAEVTTSEPDTTTEEGKTTPLESGTESGRIVKLEDPDVAMLSTSYTTRVIPNTLYKTFTYLTTFFIPEESGSTSTSIRSREVISEEIQYSTAVVPVGSDAESIVTTAVTELLQTYIPTSPEITTGRTTTEEQVTEQSQGTTFQQAETRPETTKPVPETTTPLSETTSQTSETNPLLEINSQTTPRLVDTTVQETNPPESTQTSAETKPLPETTPQPPQTTPKLVDTTLDTTPSPTTTEEPEKEVELIFKTLYTTYTYLTTFFQESATSVKSREVVVTNVLTSTFDNDFLVKASDPAVAGLFGKVDESEITPTSTMTEPPVTKFFDEDIFSSSSSTVDSENEVVATPQLKSEIPVFKTYTYYTTVFVDGETLVESRTEVLPADPTSTEAQLRTVLTEDNNVVPLSDQQVEAPTDVTTSKKRPAYDTIYRQKISLKPSSEAFTMPDSVASIQSSIDEAYNYDTTMSRDHRTAQASVDETSLPEADISRAREQELKKEALLAIGATRPEDEEVFETMITDITSSSSGGSVRTYEELEVDPNDQISSESNTEEIEPSFSPTLLLQTSYTTFTYFTTVYKGTSSDVISRLETVTNVVTETVKPTEIEAKLSPEEATLPITYFTTFTYWTTLYKGTKTMVTSREETVSNIVTPVLTVVPTTDNIEMTESTSLPTISTTVLITPTETPVEPTTFYTTYTYFTTSYVDNETIINSHLETETNIVTPTPSEVLPQTTLESSNPAESSESTPTAVQTPNLKPTGLISTIRTSEVNDGTTTLLNTDVYGTYIDGLYAQVLESSTEVVTSTVEPSSAQSIPENIQPTGIVSLNEGKIVDADGISTTFYTTKAVGTYIDQLYAQIIESTSSVQIDEERKTIALSEDPSTTVIGSKTYRTGLVRLIEGSIVKDHTTTFYESKVIGTLVDGRYAQIIESTSSFKIEMTSTPVT